MSTTRHELLDGKIQIYMRPRSHVWQCSASFNGKQFKKSTGAESLSEAKDIAEDWYLTMRGKARAGEIKEGKTFKTAAAKFLVEYEALVAGERNAKYVAGHGRRLELHLIPFFGNKVLSEITPGLVQDYRVHRLTSRVIEKTDSKTRQKTKEIVRPSRSTLHHETVTLRHVLKTAQRHGWIPFVPDLSPPYKASTKVSHRAWFSPSEHKQLVEATRNRSKNPPKERWRWACEQLHDFVLFMLNTGLRPDEAWRLEYRDVEITKEKGMKDEILALSVRGKRGTGYCKSMPGAVLPFKRIRDRARPPQLGREQPRAPKDKSSWSTEKAPTDLLFPRRHNELFKLLLVEEKLKKDREGKERTYYSLRHTYISRRLMEGADIYQVAKNCRTSVEMIEKHYAAHIKDMIDAKTLNVRRES